MTIITKQHSTKSQNYESPITKSPRHGLCRSQKKKDT